MNIEEINKRLRILEPKIKRWKWIVGTSASGVVMLAGGILMILSTFTNLIMLYIGASIVGLGLLYLIVNVGFLTKVNTYQKEYDGLIRQKQELESPSIKEDKKVLLLKLLDEGKITKEEFNELIK